MMKGWINGIGWVTAAGCNRGRNADQQPLCSGDLEIPTRKQVFEKPDMRFGRLDEFPGSAWAHSLFAFVMPGRKPGTKSVRLVLSLPVDMVVYKRIWLIWIP